MKTFYTYSTRCLPTDAAPSSRQAGIKTYHNFSRELVSSSLVVKGIPHYERAMTTEIWENIFPEKLSRPYASIEEIQKLYTKCRRCNLANHRLNVVSHRAQCRPDKATVFFIAQSPGKSEDKVAIPLVGPSGKMQDMIMREAGFHDKTIYANVVGCLPPNDNPTKEECLTCSSRLWLLLNAVKPNIIICLGSVPASIFWDNPKDVNRNSLHKIKENLYIGYVFHPSYINRRMTKGDLTVFEDMVKFLKEVSEFSKGLAPYRPTEKWSLFDDGFPFQFIRKHFPE